MRRIALTIVSTFLLIFVCEGQVNSELPSESSLNGSGSSLPSESAEVSGSLRAAPPGGTPIGGEDVPLGDIPYLSIILLTGAYVIRRRYRLKNTTI